MADFEMNADGLMVATREFLLRRGYCCGCGCRNCPYRGTPLDRRPPALRARDAGLQHQNHKADDQASDLL
ncbi:MAG TPA: DUF5522 domain-containing protein [Dehalococcoidia bacterium]|jgi:hypothetical protein